MRGRGLGGGCWLGGMDGEGVCAEAEADGNGESEERKRW